MAALLAPETWRRLGAVPTQEAGGVCLAAAKLPGTDEIRFVEGALRVPVTVVSCGETALAVACASLEKDPEAGLLGYWAALAQPLRERGMAAEPGRHGPADWFSPSVDDLRRGLGLSADDALIGLGLLSGLPVLPSAGDLASMPLVRILVAGKRRHLGAVPLRRAGAGILWCTDAVPSPAAAAERSSLFGLPALVALVEPSALRLLLDVAEEPTLVTDPAKVTEALLADGALDPQEFRALSAYARVQGCSELDALRLAGVLPREKVAQSVARALGSDWAGLRPRIDPQAGELLPCQSARLLACVPLSVRGSTLTVATPFPRDRWRLRAVEDITGLGARATYADADEVDSLLNAGWASASAGGHVRPTEAIGPPSDSAEAALHLGLQWFDLDQLRLPPQLEEAGKRGLLVVHSDGPLLWVATGSIAGAAHGEALADALGRPVRVVLAPQQQVRAALTGPGSPTGDPSGAFTEAEYRILASLRRHGWLSETERSRFLGSDGWRSAPDEALSGATGVALRDAVWRLARASGCPILDLQLQSVPEEAIDPIGLRFRRTRVVDPVDHAISGRLPEEMARRLGILLISTTHRLAVVAFASPFHLADALPELRRALGREIQPFLSASSDLRAAQRRAYRGAVLGESLVARGAIDQPDLDAALQLQREAGVRLSVAMTSLGSASEQEIAQALAEQHSRPFVALAGLDVDPDVVRRLPEQFSRQQQIVLLDLSEGEAYLGLVDPSNIGGIAEASSLLGCAVDACVLTPTDLQWVLENTYRGDYLDRSAFDLLTRSPDESASRVLTGRQKVFCVSLILIVGLCFLLAPLLAATALASLATVFHTISSLYRLLLIQRSLSRTREIRLSDEQLAALDERSLPVYTILIPLYKEREVLPILVDSIRRMDYPKVKLDVILLLEEDDLETIAVARQARLPAHFRILVVPQGQPKGKPKACNYGLLHAKGEYVVIYDAEDIPARDQLKAAIVAFRSADEGLACVQAKLNYFNPSQNILTRWFTAEYSMWFDLFLPGLESTGAPIPLGGTSNHFRTRQLQALGAWDPFNVTEDADLGIRLFKAGYKTVVIDSTTYEEANSALGNWVRQRSRWIKGYIQTYLVHMRHPLRLCRSIGILPFLSVQLTLGGTVLGLLLNPILWLITSAWFATRWAAIEQMFPSAIFYVGGLGLYVGNFVFTYLNVIGCLRRGYFSLVKYALLSPVYWALMSFAAWKGFIQLFYKPFYWEKTTHGLYNDPRPRAEGG